MPPPSTTDDLVSRLRKSGLVPQSELDPYLSRLPADVSPKGILDQMVVDRVITPFQAERLGVGKYKGFLIGGYVILDKIGSGGMGQVYLAENPALRKLVAIKVLNIPVGEDEVAKKRFIREARAANELSHPNIVRLHDFNENNHPPYIIMEFVEGVSLQTLVTKAGAQPYHVAADIARQVALGLQHAFEKSLVHRDIKPGNILVNREGGVRILDFGLVRTMDETDTKLTNQLGGRNILGTADYLAPEQALNSSAVDTRADIYALGATLYFLLAGHPMFPTGRTAQKLMWQQWKDPTPIRELKPDVPPELAVAVHKAIAKKPEQRFQTPQEFADALAPFTTGRVPPDPELIPVPPTRRGFGSVPGSATRLATPTRPNSSANITTTPAPAPAYRPASTIPRIPAYPQDLPQRYPTADDTPTSANGRTLPESIPPIPEPASLPSLEPPPIEWKKRPQPDPEDVIMGSAAFLALGQPRRPSSEPPAEVEEALNAVPRRPLAAPASPLPWVTLALAAGLGAGAAAAVLLLSR